MDLSKLTPQSGNPTNDPEESAAKAQKAAQEEQMRREMIATVLDSDARERLNRIALVNPQLSAQVESILVRMAQSGQLRGRVTEQQLIGLLDQADGQRGGAATAKKGAIVVSVEPEDTHERLLFQGGERGSSFSAFHSIRSLTLAHRQFQRRKDLDDDDWDI